MTEVVPIDGGVEVTVSTSFKVNLGNYESKDIFGAAKARFAADADPEEIGAFLFDRVYGAMGLELEQAAMLAPKGSAVKRIVD